MKPFIWHRALAIGRSTTAAYYRCKFSSLISFDLAPTVRRRTLDDDTWSSICLANSTIRYRAHIFLLCRRCSAAGAIQFLDLSRFNIYNWGEEGGGSETGSGSCWTRGSRHRAAAGNAALPMTWQHSQCKWPTGRPVKDWWLLTWRSVDFTSTEEGGIQVEMFYCPLLFFFSFFVFFFLLLFCSSFDDVSECLCVRQVVRSRPMMVSNVELRCRSLHWSFKPRIKWSDQGKFLINCNLI